MSESDSSEIEDKDTQNEPEGSSSIDWNPMRDHYYNSPENWSGNKYLDHDGNQVVIPLKDRKVKNIPCEFHDGFSGKCYKGSRCVYGHDMHTGGLFEKKFPDKVVPPEYKESICHHIAIGNDPTIQDKMEFKIGSTIVASIVNASRDNLNPYKFYFIPESFEDLDEGKNDKNIKVYNKEDLDNLEKDLHEYMIKNRRYLELQSICYDGLEIVAVKAEIKDKDGKPVKKWIRGIVGEAIYCHDREIEVTYMDRPMSKSSTFPLMDVARLPKEFFTCNSYIYRAYLTGVSQKKPSPPWSKSAINLLKKSLNKKVSLIVEEIFENKGLTDKHHDTYFEDEYYGVNIIIPEGNSLINLKREMAKLETVELKEDDKEPTPGSSRAIEYINKPNMSCTFYDKFFKPPTNVKK